MGLRRRAACRDNTKKPSRRFDCLNRSPSFLRRLYCAGRYRCQIHHILKNNQSNSLRKQRAPSGAESIEEIVQLCVDSDLAGCRKLLIFGTPLVENIMLCPWMHLPSDITRIACDGDMEACTGQHATIDLCWQPITTIDGRRKTTIRHRGTYGTHKNRKLPPHQTRN